MFPESRVQKLQGWGQGAHLSPGRASRVFKDAQVLIQQSKGEKSFQEDTAPQSRAT